MWDGATAGEPPADAGAGGRDMYDSPGDGLRGVRGESGGAGWRKSKYMTAARAPRSAGDFAMLSVGDLEPEGEEEAAARDDGETGGLSDRVGMKLRGGDLGEVAGMKSRGGDLGGDAGGVVVAAANPAPGWFRRKRE